MAGDQVPASPRVEEPQSYELRSTSARSAESEAPLSLRSSDEGHLTRRVLAYQVVANEKNPAACLHIKLFHQRRATAQSKWVTPRPFNLGRLKSAEEVCLDLHSEEVLELYKHLQNLYAVAIDGVPQGRRAFQVVDKSKNVVFSGEGGLLLRQLLDQYGSTDFFRLLQSLAPDLFSAAGMVAIQEERAQALREFENQMSAGKWTENDWYPFFEGKQWIFGHGLAYQFLQRLQSQAYVGGQAISGREAQRSDYMMATKAHIRFTVLVEVKRPDTLLLGSKYRSGVYNIGSELTGGVAQLQTNCRTWATEGSRSEANRDLGVETYEPKGILVIGNLSQLDGPEKKDKARSFELFRRNLRNPEVITFDELLERARFLVASLIPEVHASSPTARRS